MKQHASDRRLQRWVDNDAGRLERYLAEHPDETDRIDALTEFAVPLREQLLAAYAPPTNILAAIGQRLRDELPKLDTTRVIGELIIGAATTAAILFIDEENTP